MQRYSHFYLAALLTLLLTGLLLLSTQAEGGVPGASQPSRRVTVARRAAAVARCCAHPLHLRRADSRRLRRCTRRYFVALDSLPAAAAGLAAGLELRYQAQVGRALTPGQYGAFLYLRRHLPVELIGVVALYP